MPERYEYQGVPLNTPIIRYILRNRLQLPLEWWSTNEFEEKIKQYHQENEGEPTELINPHAAVYGVLRELVRQEILESYTEAGERYFRLLSDTPDPVERLIRVIKQERERLDEVVETLNQRKELLDIILSEYE